VNVEFAPKTLNDAPALSRLMQLYVQSSSRSTRGRGWPCPRV